VKKGKKGDATKLFKVTGPRQKILERKETSSMVWRGGRERDGRRATLLIRLGDTRNINNGGSKEVSKWVKKILKGQQQKG